jgi:hypothetical protein
MTAMGRRSAVTIHWGWNLHLPGARHFWVTGFPPRRSTLLTGDAELKAKAVDCL